MPRQPCAAPTVGDSADWSRRLISLSIDLDLPGAFTQGGSAARAVASAFMASRPGATCRGLSIDLLDSTDPVVLG